MHSLDLVDIEEIQGVAWVFSPSQLMGAIYKLGDGVSNIFVLRYRSSLETLPFPDEASMYPSYQDSYSLQLFWDLQAVVDLADKILNWEGAYQGTFFRGTGETFIHSATVDYLIRSTTASLHKTKRQCYRCCTESGMTKRAHISPKKSGKVSGTRRSPNCNSARGCRIRRSKK
jgi:hypothetical protein